MPADSERARLFAVLAHETRHEILLALKEHGPLSPTQYCDLSCRRKDLSRISYHFTILASAGCIALVETRQRRGAVEHVYATTELGSAALAFLMA